MSNRTYDTLKKIAQVWIPAVSTLCATVMGLFGVDPAIIAVTTGCLAAADTFLGTVLGISTKNYNEKQKGDE